MDGLIAWLSALLAAAFPFLADPGPEPALGYVEADYLYLAPACSGPLSMLAVEDGESVPRNAPLFRVEDTQRKAALAAAEARLSQAEAELHDRQRGDRPEEIDVIEQRLAGAGADLALARTAFARSRRLREQDVASAARLDEDRAKLRAAEARVAQFEAEREVARLPDRDDQIAAAEADVAAARAAVAEAGADLADCYVSAPLAARVERTFLQPGEQAGPDQPVVSLLPPEQLKVRFHVAQARRSDFALGSRVLVDCDSCAAPVPAKVTWLASEAEYTPPVIYSLDERDRLVFLAEARPQAPAPALLPGQPVDVRPADGR